MKYKKRHNELSEMYKMIHTVSDNISLTGEHTYTDSQFLNLLQTTEKNYFTPIEREDIFLIACHIQNLNDEIYLLRKTTENDFFLNPEKTKKSVNEIIKLLTGCSEMLRELEKLPKIDSMTKIYGKFRTDFSCIVSRNNNNNFNNCINYCRKIADSIYFSYLKNT